MPQELVPTGPSSSDLQAATLDDWLKEVSLDDHVSASSVAEPARVAASESGEPSVAATAVLSSREYAAHLRSSHLSLQDATPKFFWEQGFWSDFFGPASVPETIMPRFKDRRPDPYHLPLPEPVEIGQSQSSKKPRREFAAVFQQVVVQRQVISWRDAREASFETAIVKWVALFGSWDSNKDESLDGFALLSELEQRKVIDDSIARKAPSTALKRANSLIKLTKLAGAAHIAMPASEGEIYIILNDAKSGGAPLSQLRGFMEAITFSRHVFEIRCLHLVSVSKRCWGVTVARVATPARQADPLRVKDLRELHRVLDEVPDPWDRCFAGSALFCAYGRCQWSDSQHLDDIALEYEEGSDSPLAFVGGVIDIHKTMNLQGQQPRVLEIVAQGIYEGDWAMKWLAARAEVGCAWSQGHPTMPAPNHLGEPTVRALGSDECGAWLRALLPTRLDMRTTSHSLESNLLELLCKEGLLQGVIREIRMGVFVPDANRAGRLIDNSEHEGDLSEADDGESSSKSSSKSSVEGTTSSDSDASSSSEEDGPGPRIPQFVPRLPEPPDGFRFVQHAKLKTLHYVMQGHLNFTVCGRRITDSLTGSLSLKWDSPVCRNCKKSVGKGVTTRGVMSLIDSKAEFESRCKDVCGSSALLENLRAKGIESFSSLAFACGTPQTPPTETEFTSFAENVCGPAVALGTAAQLRRLHFEAITLVVAQLKQQAIADPAEAVKKLPLAEKQARIEDQRRRLHGLLLEDELQPSHALIDACAHMIEQNHITWVPPSKCTKRDQELRVGFKDKSKFRVAAEGGVTLASAPTVLTADHQTPLQLQWCLQRRGLALDLNNIIGWTSHERWVSYLMQTLAQEVPAGYHSVTVDQLLKADCELFLLISKETKRVKVGSDGTMEAEVKLNQLKTDSRVTMHLLPIRGGGKPSGSQAIVEVPVLDDANARLKKRRTLDKRRGLMAPVKTATMPQELKACPHHTDSAGRRACWGFNLGRCSLATQGSPPTCQKGVHICVTCRKPGHGHFQCWHAGKGKGAGKGKKGAKAAAEAANDARSRTPLKATDAETSGSFSCIIQNPSREITSRDLSSKDARTSKDDCQSADHHPVDRDKHTTPPNASNPVDAASSCSSGLLEPAAHFEHAHTNAENKIFHFPPEAQSDGGGSDESDRIACQILAAGQCTALQLLQLMASLPSEDMARSSGTVGTEKSFTSGAYGQGPLVGLRKHISSHAHVTRLLVKLAVQFFPALTFTTVALFRDVQTTRHSDKGNLPGSLNGVAALSSFSAGHIKLHTSDGERILDVATCPVLFDPVVEHETCSWEGTPALCWLHSP
ncbi:unnamed protein product [Symbiodinium sp. CCMP2592]|nr:unnamed protein product [Symbiodinium sp. CCMP2592]